MIALIPKYCIGDIIVYYRDRFNTETGETMVNHEAYCEQVISVQLHGRTWNYYTEGNVSPEEKVIAKIGSLPLVSAPTFHCETCCEY